MTEVGRVFKTEEDMAMWFTADENFLPVKVRFDIFVGSFHVDMTNYEGLRAPLNLWTNKQELKIFLWLQQQISGTAW